MTLRTKWSGGSGWAAGWVLVASAALSITGCSSSGDTSTGGSGVTTVKYGYPAPVASLLPLYVASMNPSICEPLGVKLDPVLLDPASLITAVASGSVPVSQDAITGLVPAVEKSPNSIHIVALTGPQNIGFFGNKSVGTVADLKGKTIAVSAPGASSDIYARIALKDAGLSAESDVKIVYTKVSSASLTQAIAGNVDALPASPPLPGAAVAAGLHALDAGSLAPGSVTALVMSHGLAVDASYTSQHRDVVTNVLKCIDAATKYIPTHKAERDAALVKFTGINSSQAEETYEANKITFEDGLQAPSEASMNKILDALVGVGVYSKDQVATPVGQFLDPSRLTS
jgi:NitT/TauT family transport system substrate-binding protein